jgi:SAM-dependent methyltransferase
MSCRATQPALPGLDGLPGSVGARGGGLPEPAGSGYLARVFRATEELNRRAFLRAVPRRPGGALLDIGTHRGDFTTRVAQRMRADHVAGVEFLPQHATVASQRGIDITVANAEDGLPYPNATFDVITANQIIEHLRATDRFLTEIHRLLRPGGTAVISTNNMASWHNVLSLALGLQPLPMHVSDQVIVGNPLNPEHRWPHEDQGRTHLRLFTGRALRELAHHHGLHTQHLRTVGYYPLPPRLAALATRIDPRHGAFLLATLRR